MLIRFKETRGVRGGVDYASEEAKCMIIEAMLTPCHYGVRTRLWGMMLRRLAECELRYNFIMACGSDHDSEVPSRSSKHKTRCVGQRCARQPNVGE